MVDEREWEPILDGELAEQAQAAVRDIARAMADGKGVGSDPTDLTLFWAYVAGAIDEEWTSTAFDNATEALLANIAGGTPSIALHGGIAGAGWVLAHVSDGDAGDEVLAAIDDALLGVLSTEKWTRDYDLIGGLAGLGVYFLERGEAGRAGLSRIVDHLVALAEQTPHGTAWFTPPNLVPMVQRERWPTGYFNCGLAHGVPGPIALLGRIAALPDPDPRAKPLCESALSWLAAQALPPNERGRYPSSFRRDEPPTSPARTAWCYGEPGLALASYGASRRIGAPSASWLGFARDAARRPQDLCNVNDAGFCHGSVGLAHIYNRIYQSTGETTFRDAAREWVRHAFANRRDEGLAGFAAWTVGQSGQFEYLPAADLVEGAVGVALSLLACVQETEPGWDRMLQCDLPLGPRER